MLIVIIVIRKAAWTKHGKTFLTYFPLLCKIYFFKKEEEEAPSIHLVCETSAIRNQYQKLDTVTVAGVILLTR